MTVYSPGEVDTGNGTLVANECPLKFVRRPPAPPPPTVVWLPPPPPPATTRYSTDSAVSNPKPNEVTVNFPDEVKTCAL